jgi:putative ABC transport system permease protein
VKAILESAAIAIEAIWGAKLRSFMTVLGNIVAVTSIIAVVSLIQGLNVTVRDAILSQAGADSFGIQQYPVTRSDEEFERVRGNPRLTMRDAQAIVEYSASAAAVMAEARSNGRVTYRDRSIDRVRITGVSAAYTRFSNYDAERGRLMSATEVDRAQPVAVVGWQIADRLFGAGVPAVDQTIKVEGVHFRIVGVSGKRGTVLGQSQDEFVVVPLGQFERIFGSRSSLSIAVRPRDLSLLPRTMDEAAMALRIARRLEPSQPDNFGLFTSDTFLDIYYSATTGIFAVLVGVVALSLLVGGIVIMNIMLMVVTERTQEIGLRRGLGAKRRDIVTQILTESTVLSVFGGLVGTGLGAAIATIISSFTPVPASVEPWSIALGVGITATVGLLFGLYPALRAARLDPIEALGRE